MRLFVIKDLARQDYHGQPFFAENEDVCKRSWRSFCQSLESQPHVEIKDFEVVELSYNEVGVIFNAEEK